MSKWFSILLAVAFVVGAAGCRSVPYHEKGRLRDPIMSFDESAAEVHFHHKTYYSREGSVGGIGTSAGGGCGCY